MTPIQEIIFSGFVSKVVNDIVEISKDKISSAVKNKNTKHQNIESQIYNVTIDVLNKVAYNACENKQTKIYDTTEMLLKSFKENKEDKLSIKFCLRGLGLNADENKCLEFKASLCKELGREEYGELFRSILLLLLDQKNQYDYVVYEQLNQKLDEVNLKIDDLDQKMDDIQKIQDDTLIQDKIVKFQNNKKYDYIKNWNSRMFLHAHNNENPITLENAFIMPDFEMHKYIDRIGFSNDDTLDIIIEKFVEYNKTSTMLITGVPGIGKSTITSWIGNQYRYDNKVIILRFRDWEREELVRGLLSAIYNTLKCKRKDLEEKILVLDGFDEMKTLDLRDQLLDDFYTNIKDFRNTKFIITSRPAYINPYYIQNTLVLKEFDISKVNEFCKIIIGEVIDDEVKINSNLDVLGIPVILYMAIMSGINISEYPTKPELYNRIFAEKGGIFDKFFDGENEYSPGSQIMRNPNNIKKYLKFLRKVAFMMFESNRPYLNIEDCNVPKLEFQEDIVSILEFPIKHLFENTENNIEFIHKTIYEYFVSEYIFFNMKNVLQKNGLKKEELARVLGSLFKRQILSKEILDFLKYKIRNKINLAFDIVYKTFELMLGDGMTYYTGECYKNVMDCEMNVFANMLEFLHLWNEGYHMIYDMSLKRYLSYNNWLCLNLRGLIIGNRSDGIKPLDFFTNFYKADLAEADFSDVYFGGINLREANLSGANLRDAGLRNADLSDANLSDANLSGAGLGDADLRGADLRGADLRGADLRGAYLRSAFLSGADLSDANLSGAYLRGAYLNGANLRGAGLGDAVLGDADLRGASLLYADLSDADLSDADLRGADLRGAGLSGAGLSGVKIKDTIIDEYQVIYLKKLLDLNGTRVRIGNKTQVLSYEEYISKRV